MINVRTAAFAAVGLAGLIAAGRVGYGCGRQAGSRQADALVQALEGTQATIRTKEALYQTTLTQVDDARRLLEAREVENRDMLRQLDAAKARVLTTERVSVRWIPRRAESIRATQADVRPTTPWEAHRTRVDFSHDFGPFVVSGHTLTDPAEASLEVVQGRPLALTLAVSRDRDGRWLSHVSSSDPDVRVDVTLGAVDPGVVGPRWYQRFWATGAAGVLGGTSLGVGLEYRGDRYSLGPQCQLWSGGHACGVSLGVRLGR